LRAEQGDLRRAEEFLRAALKKDPTMAAAAYNLAVILSKDRMAEAIEWCRKARDANAAEPKYGYTLAFYLNQSGRPEAAVRQLEEVISRSASYVDAYLLLASILESRGERERAGAVYRRALKLEGIAPQTRELLNTKLAALVPDRRR
jgi:Tfp pilus assembly protein PilF